MKTEALLLAGLIVASVAPGQAKPKPPLFADPRFDSMVIDGFDLYAVDPNHAEGIDAALASALLGTEQGLLNLRGYTWPMVTVRVPQIMPSEAMLSKPAPQWLQDIGDLQHVWHKEEKVFRMEHVQTHRWVVIISIDEIPTNAKLIKGTMSLSLYVYDRRDATLLWHDHVERSVNAGPLGNIIEKKSDIKNWEAEDMAREMAAKLPKRKKR